MTTTTRASYLSPAAHSTHETACLGGRFSGDTARNQQLPVPRSPPGRVLSRGGRERCGHRPNPNGPGGPRRPPLDAPPAEARLPGLIGRSGRGAALEPAGRGGCRRSRRGGVESGV